MAIPKFLSIYPYGLSGQLYCQSLRPLESLNRVVLTLISNTKKLKLSVSENETTLNGFNKEAVSIREPT